MKCGRLLPAVTLLFVIAGLPTLGAPVTNEPQAPGNMAKLAIARTDPWPSPLVPAFESASAKYKIPLPLLLALAYYGSAFENRGDAPTIENGYGVMALRQNSLGGTSLAEAAALTGVSESDLKLKADANIMGAAAVLDSYAKMWQVDRMAGLDVWLNVIIKYAALDPAKDAVPVCSRFFAMEIYEKLKNGLDTVNSSGEHFSFAPQSIGSISLVSLEPPGARVGVTGYSGATWYPAGTCNYVAVSEAKNTVIVHTIEGSASGCLSWFRNCTAQVSSHYVVSEGGGVWQCVDEWYRAWHVGSANTYCLGIEHEGYAASASHPQALYDASALLTRDMCNRWGIPKEHRGSPPGILGHVDMNNCCVGGSHWDPGGGWDWTYYINQVNGVLTWIGSYRAQSYPATMVAGTQAAAWVEYTNGGTGHWVPGETRLGTSSPNDRSSSFATVGDWYSASRPTNVDQGDVGPGGVGRFSFTLTAPASPPGTYVEHFRPVREGITWFGDEITWTIKVTSTHPYLKNWLILGPYSAAGVDVNSLGVDEASLWAWSGRSLNGKTWTSCNSSWEYVDLLAAFGSADGTNSYAWTYVNSPSAKTVYIRSGSDDEFKVWLNGSVVFTRLTGGAHVFDGDTIGPLTLNAGWNRLLVKVHNATGPYGFSLRFADDAAGTVDTTGLTFTSDEVADWWPRVYCDNAYDGTYRPAAGAALYGNNATVAVSGAADSYNGPVPVNRIEQYHSGYNGTTAWSSANVSGTGPWSYSEPGFGGYNRFYFRGVSNSERASSTWGNDGRASYFDLFIDDQPPQPPSFIDVQTAGADQVNLSWITPSDQGVGVGSGSSEYAAVGGDNAYRCGDVAVQVRRDGTPAYGWGSAGSFADTGLSANTLYTYDIAARDNNNGGRGAWSNATAYLGSTSKYTLIESPTALSFTNMAEHSVGVGLEGSFSSLASGDSGLMLLCNNGQDSGWRKQSTVWDCAGLESNTRYSFMGMARNGDGIPSPSVGADRYTLIQTPNGLRFGAVTETSIEANIVGPFSGLASGSSGVLVTNTTAVQDSGWQRSSDMWASTGLAPNTQYAFQAKARNGDGVETDLAGASAWTLSVPPSESTVTCNRATSTWYGTPPFVFTAVGGFGPGTVDHYLYAWNQHPCYSFTGTEGQKSASGLFEAGGGDRSQVVYSVTDDVGSFEGDFALAEGSQGPSCAYIGSGSVWNAGDLAVDATDSGDWYLHVEGYNGEGVPNGVLTLGPYRYDGTGPGAVAVTDEGALTPSLTTLRATWTAASDGNGSGIAGYDYAVGTDPNQQNTKSWTWVGDVTAMTDSTLSLAEGQQYFIQVRARDNAALIGPASSSDGIMAAAGVSKIGLAWPIANSVGLSLRNKIVTGALSGMFWLEEMDRTAGIEVVSDAEVSGGDIVSVAGVLGVSGAQRVLVGDVVEKQDTGTVPQPLLVIQRALGGADFNALTPGVTAANGLYNIGLLVTVVGNVTHSDTSNAGANYFYLDDGSGLSDGSGHAGVRVLCGGNTPPATGTAIVTGLVSNEQVTGAVVPIIIIRDSGDIVH